MAWKKSSSRFYHIGSISQYIDVNNHQGSKVYNRLKKISGEYFWDILVKGYGLIWICDTVIKFRGICCKVGNYGYFGMSHLTWKKVKIDNNKLTTIQEHNLCCNYSQCFAHFSILTTETNGLIKLCLNLHSKLHKVFAPLSYFKLNGTTLW